MIRFEKNSRVINELIQIQQDRASAYEEMMRYGNFDAEINGLLGRLASQCRNNILELRVHISDNTGSDPADHVEIPGEMKVGSFSVDQRKPPAFLQERVHIEA